MEYERLILTAFAIVSGLQFTFVTFNVQLLREKPEAAENFLLSMFLIFWSAAVQLLIMVVLASEGYESVIERAVIRTSDGALALIWAIAVMAGVFGFLRMYLATKALILPHVSVRGSKAEPTAKDS